MHNHLNSTFEHAFGEYASPGPIQREMQCVHASVSPDPREDVSSESSTHQIWGNALLNICSQCSLSCLLSNVTISDGQTFRLEQKHKTSASSRKLDKKKTISEGLDVNLNNLYCWLSFLSQQLISAEQDLSPLRFHTEQHWTCGWTPTETLFECIHTFLSVCWICSSQEMQIVHFLQCSILSDWKWVSSHLCLCLDYRIKRPPRTALSVY